MLPEIPAQYVLPVSRTDWSVLLEEWKPLLPKQFKPWILTKFGELFVCQDDGPIGMLQVSTFRYEVVAKDMIDFLEWLEDPDKLAVWFLAPLIDRLESSGKFLTEGQCFSFIAPLGLGGQLSVENVMAIPLKEHFGCWGDVYKQIKDLVPGTQVVLTTNKTEGASDSPRKS